MALFDPHVPWDIGFQLSFTATLAPVLWAGATHADWSARRLQAAFAEAGIRPHLLQGGEALDLGDGAQLSAVLVSSRGAVLLLEWGAFRALLPLGLDGSALEQLPAAADLGPLTALLLAESGYAPANPPEWIRALAPEVVLLGVAADDYAGLPLPETLQAVEDYTLLRTDRDGWIELAMDGEQLWVEVEKGQEDFGSQFTSGAYTGIGERGAGLKPDGVDRAKLDLLSNKKIMYNEATFTACSELHDRFGYPSAQ